MHTYTLDTEHIRPEFAVCLCTVIYRLGITGNLFRVRSLTYRGSVLCSIMSVFHEVGGEPLFHYKTVSATMSVFHYRWAVGLGFGSRVTSLGCGYI